MPAHNQASLPLLGLCLHLLVFCSVPTAAFHFLVYNDSLCTQPLSQYSLDYPSVGPTPGLVSNRSTTWTSTCLGAPPGLPYGSLSYICHGSPVGLALVAHTWNDQQCNGTAVWVNIQTVNIYTPDNCTAGAIFNPNTGSRLPVYTQLNCNATQQPKNSGASHLAVFAHLTLRTVAVCMAMMHLVLML